MSPGRQLTGPDGSLVGKGDAYVQAVQTLRNIQLALEKAGASDGARGPHAHFRHRYFAMGRTLAAHGDEFFSTIRPATSMIQISQLIDPEMLVEIEAEAFVPQASTQ